MILQHPNKILRRKSKEVLLPEITKPKIKNIIKEMKRILISSADKGGVALAAPQIGYSLRIFIIFENILKIGGENKNPPKFFVFINPEIIKKSRKKQILSEGCLSVDGAQGKVKRAEKLTVKALDENAKEFKMSATKFMSEAIEHEIDHLDGVLFIDKALKTE